MTTEATVPSPGDSQSGLPAITGVEAKRVHYDPPERFYLRGRLVAEREAIELLVRTSGPLPVHGSAPALFIGNLIVNDFDMVEPDLYLFRAYGVDRFKPGAPISLGFPGAPETKVPTKFRFELPGVLPKS